MITRTAKHEPSPLHQSLDFTDEDLAENQQGRITAHQQQRLHSHEQRKLIMASAVIGVIWLFVAGSAIQTLTSNDSNRNPTALVLLVLIMLAATYAIMSEKWQRWTSVQADLAAPAGQVRTLTGPVKVYSQKLARTPTVYTVSVMGEAIEIPEGAFFVFQEGTRYHIYVTKISHVILSAALAGPETAVPDQKRLY